MRKHSYFILPGLVVLVIGLAARSGYAAPQDPEKALERAEQAVQSVWIEDGDRGWLGVGISEVTAGKAKELKLPAVRGALLTEVESNSPAGKAGLKADDVITEYNGQRIEGTAQLRRMIRETPAGRTVQLTVWRDGRAQSLSVEVGNLHDQMGKMVQKYAPKEFHFDFKMPEFGGNAFTMLRAPILGIGAEDLSGQLGSYFGAPDGEGVLVTEVHSGTPAEKAGLKAGDVITKVADERVRSVSELREKLREKREAKTVSLNVLRKGTEMSVNVELEQPKPPADRKRIISRRISI